MDVEHIVGDIEDHRLREELRSCQHFLVDSELERDTKYSITQWKLSTKQSLTRDLINYFIRQQFEKCSKSESGFWLHFQKKEDGGFRCFYAHKNKTLLDRSKFVRTHDDLAKLKDFLNNTDVIESYSRERMNTKWRFYKLTNLTVFAALLKDVPMGCKNAALPEPLFRNHTINCLTFEENSRQPKNNNLCLFRALALHLHGNQRLEEETSKIFNLFIKKMNGLSADQFQGVHMNEVPIVEYLLTLNILLYDIDSVDGNIIGELARRSMQKYDNTVRLLRYNNHICYVSNINVVFQTFRCPNCDTFFSRTFNLEQHLTKLSERVKMSIRGTYIKSEKLCLTRWVLLVSNTRVNKNSSKKLAVFDF